MTTITVFSDSHGTPLPTKLTSVAFESNLVFFLGDGILSLGDMLLHNGFHAVKGNCDPSCGFCDEEVVEVENVRILLTHGDKYRVKSDLTSLYACTRTRMQSCIVRSHALCRRSGICGSYARKPGRNILRTHRRAVIRLCRGYQRKICRQNSKSYLNFLT